MVLFKWHKTIHIFYPLFVKLNCPRSHTCSDLIWLPVSPVPRFYCTSMHSWNLLLNSLKIAPRKSLDTHLKMQAFPWRACPTLYERVHNQSTLTSEFLFCDLFWGLKALHCWAVYMYSVTVTHQMKWPTSSKNKPTGSHSSKDSTMALFKFPVACRSS